MLRQLGWGQDVPLYPLPRGRGGRLRLRLLAVTALCLVVVGWFAGLTSTGPGWAAIALAVLLVALLMVHRNDGRLARALAEYALVAVLVVLVATSIGAHQPAATHPAPRPKPAAAAGAGAACPDPLIRQARAWLVCVWHRAMDPPPTPSTTTRPHHR